jgi:hypothetical protein
LRLSRPSCSPHATQPYECNRSNARNVCRGAGDLKTAHLINYRIASLTKQRLSLYFEYDTPGTASINIPLLWR